MNVLSNSSFSTPYLWLLTTGTYFSNYQTNLIP